MLKFIFKRLLEALPTLFILITFSFFLMRLALVARSHQNVLIHQKSWQISKRSII